MIKARVNVETAKKNYTPGEIIHEQLSAADMAFLKKKGFIIEESEIVSDVEEDDSANRDGENPAYIHGIQNPREDGEGSENSMEYKNEAALKKLNKDEIVEYAKSIGLSITPDMLKNDMIDSVLNHIEQKIAEAVG